MPCPVFPESPEAQLLPLLWGATRALPPSSVLSRSQGRKWWMNTDEPWQVLACCMEVAKASRSPDPAAFVSHFPVHQVGADGFARPGGPGGELGAEPRHPGLQLCSPCGVARLSEGGGAAYGRLGLRTQRFAAACSRRRSGWVRCCFACAWVTEPVRGTGCRPQGRSCPLQPRDGDRERPRCRLAGPRVVQAAPACSEALEAALGQGTRRLRGPQLLSSQGLETPGERLCRSKDGRRGPLRTEMSRPLRSLVCLWPQVLVPTQPQRCPCSRQGLPSRSGAARIWRCPSVCPSVRPSLLERSQALLPTPASALSPAASQQISSPPQPLPSQLFICTDKFPCCMETVINSFPGERGLLVYLIRRSDGPNEAWGGGWGRMLLLAVVWNARETV